MSDPSSTGKGTNGATSQAASATAGKPAPDTQRVNAAGSQVAFNTDDLKSTYCNVCNGSSTREEVVVNFGVNDTWDMNSETIRVNLQHRIVMSPHAAKRVRDMMIRLIDEHESRYGKLDK